jgi:hypothetical protein
MSAPPSGFSNRNFELPAPAVGVSSPGRGRGAVLDAHLDHVVLAEDALPVEADQLGLLDRWGALDDYFPCVVSGSAVGMSRAVGRSGRASAGLDPDSHIHSNATNIGLDRDDRQRMGHRILATARAEGFTPGARHVLGRRPRRARRQRGQSRADRGVAAAPSPADRVDDSPRPWKRARPAPSWWRSRPAKRPRPRRPTPRCWTRLTWPSTAVPPGVTDQTPEPPRPPDRRARARCWSRCRPATTCPLTDGRCPVAIYDQLLSAVRKAPPHDHRTTRTTTAGKTAPGIHTLDALIDQACRAQQLPPSAINSPRSPTSPRAKRCPTNPSCSSSWTPNAGT